MPNNVFLCDLKSHCAYCRVLNTPCCCGPHAYFKTVTVSPQIKWGPSTSCGGREAVFDGEVQIILPPPELDELNFSYPAKACVLYPSGRIRVKPTGLGIMEYVEAVTTWNVVWFPQFDSSYKFGE
jgi:hypothetical protein